MNIPPSSPTTGIPRLLIVGAGDRGRTYGAWISNHPDSARVSMVADPDRTNRDALADAHHLPESARINDWREALANTSAYDAVILATPDALHKEQAIAFSKAGVPTLLEKPLAVNETDALAVMEAVRRNGNLFALCHVLRYTEYTRLLKSILDSGRIGDLVCIQHLEPVGYWHQAHSFVRGNWAREAESSSMLLAKSCHDLDWLQYLVGAPCRQVSSFGSLLHFRPENKPEGASDRCINCAVAGECPYNAMRIYPDLLKRGVRGWPVRVVTDDLTPEGIARALKTGPYGRCVYNGDNDVVDHQVVALEYENGVSATFTMTAFTGMTYGRTTRIFGTRGEILGNSHTLEITDFLSGKTETLTPPPAKGDAHGGGDAGVMEAFIRALQGDTSLLVTGIGESWASHQTIFAAENARKQASVVTLGTEPS